MSEMKAFQELCEKATARPWKYDGPDKFTEEEPWTHVVVSEADSDLLIQVGCDYPRDDSHRSGAPGCDPAIANAKLLTLAANNVKELVEALQHYLGAEGFDEYGQGSCAACTSAVALLARIEEEAKL